MPFTYYYYTEKINLNRCNHNYLQQEELNPEPLMTNTSTKDHCTTKAFVAWDICATSHTHGGCARQTQHCLQTWQPAHTLFILSPPCRQVTTSTRRTTTTTTTTTGTTLTWCPPSLGGSFLLLFKSTSLTMNNSSMRKRRQRHRCHHITAVTHHHQHHDDNDVAITPPPLLPLLYESNGDGRPPSAAHV